MRYTKLDNGKYQLSQSGKYRVKGMLASSGKSLLTLALSMGWGYEKLWRSLNGYRQLTEDEFNLLDTSLLLVTGSRIDSDCCEPVGVV